MRVVGALLLLTGCAGSGLDDVGDLSPRPDAAADLLSGCGKDTDCKGDRICVSGKCVDPAPVDLAMKLDLQAPPDLDPPADMTTVPDMAATCGVKGLSCCPGDVCSGGLFCSFGWCQDQCGVVGKVACDGPEGPCAKGLLPSGSQTVMNAKCTTATLYCLAANGCGFIGQPCCDQNGAPLQGMGVGLCNYGFNKGYCNNNNCSACP